MHRRGPGHGGDLRKGVSVRAATEVALEAMALTQVVRPGDLVVLEPILRRAARPQPQVDWRLTREMAGVPEKTKM